MSFFTKFYCVFSRNKNWVLQFVLTRAIIRLQGKDGDDMTLENKQLYYGPEKQEWVFSHNASFTHSLAKNPQQLDPIAHNFIRHTSEQHQLLIFLSGGCKMVTDEGEQVLQPGDVCFNSAMTYYGITVIDDTPYERAVIFFNADGSLDELAREVFGSAGIINVDIRKHLLPWIERYKEYAKMLPVKSFAPLGTTLIKELLYICMMSNSAVDNSIDTAENILKNALAYIDTHWSHLKNIQEISSALFISPSYLYEIFNKKMGIPPKTYLMQKRLQAAHAYLISGLQPIEVSQLVGFNTYTAFYRACKSFYGKTPQEIWMKKTPQNKP